jgi:hypothetical protein
VVWQGSQHAGLPVQRGGPFDQWPSGVGFDYFYGFLGGETDQWTPYLFENNRQVFPWIGKPGYNLISDMADKAIDYMKGLKAAAPDSPWFVYYVPGGSHSPYQPKQEWIDRMARRSRHSPQIYSAVFMRSSRSPCFGTPGDYTGWMLRRENTIGGRKVKPVWSENWICLNPRWFVTAGLDHRGYRIGQDHRYGLGCRIHPRHGVCRRCCDKESDAGRGGGADEITIEVSKSAPGARPDTAFARGT